MSVSGIWEGKLLDMSGPVARIAAVLKQSKEAVTGEFSVYVESARGSCGCGDWKLAQTAAVTGSYKEQGENLRLTYELNLGSKPVGVVFDAQLKDADPHAVRALVGSYTVGGQGTQIGFAGGACVLWLYRDQER